MFYVDTHIHLQDYKTQIVKNVVNSAAENDVKYFINVSAHPNDWEKVAKLAAEYPQITPAFGVHPWYINDVAADWENQLQKYVSSFPTAMIGECGIDRIKKPNTERQIEILHRHISLAKQYERGLIIHAVKADNVLSELFSELPKKTIFHSFTGSAQWGKQIQKHGYFLGLNFSLLRRKNAGEILRQISLEQVLLETDGPYQNLSPQSGETLPQNLPSLAEKIAELAGIDKDKFLEILKHNQLNFLGE